MQLSGALRGVSMVPCNSVQQSAVLQYSNSSASCEHSQGVRARVRVRVRSCASVCDPRPALRPRRLRPLLFVCLSKRSRLVAHRSTTSRSHRLSSASACDELPAQSWKEPVGLARKVDRNRPLTLKRRCHTVSGSCHICAETGLTPCHVCAGIYAPDGRLGRTLRQWSFGRVCSHSELAALSAGSGHWHVRFSTRPESSTSSIYRLPGFHC